MKQDRMVGKLDLLSIVSFVSVALLAIPIILILVYGFGIYNSAKGYSGEMFLAIALTFFTSALASIVVFIVFTPLAYSLSRRPSRIMETITDIPAGIPHPIVGIALLILGSPLTPIGKFLQSIGISFFFSVQGIIAALIFISAPIYIRSMQSAFASRSSLPELYSASLGASRWRTLYSAVLPSMAREAVSSTLTAMSRGMSEYGSIAIIAFYVTQFPFSGVSTASVLIFQYYSFFGPGVAITASALMIVLSLPVMIITRVISHPTGSARLS